jgi:rhomboid protease GluP
VYDILHQRYWALIHSALTSKHDAKIVMLQPNEARLFVDGKRLLVVLLDEQPKETVALQNWAKILLEESRVREIDVVVLAPSNDVDRTLSESEFQVPWTTRLAIFTLNESGAYHEITNKQADSFTHDLIEASLQTSTPVESLKQDVRSILEEQGKKTGEVVNFQRKLQGYYPLATYVLLAVIGAFFAVQMMLNAEDYVPGLVRLGADSAILVKQGQYWRLITSIFLHGGFLHVAVNCYFLYVLGVFFNKLIGNARFLTLFFVSGLVGSLASVFISGAPLSVGASGALWGLFGLSAALIIKPTEFLPDEVRQNLRNITVINLALNVGISFAVPMIDKWAHFGGGFGGLLVGLAFVYEPKYQARQMVHTVLATVMCSLAALCIAANLYVERPWVLRQPLELTDRSLFHHQLTVGVPSFLDLKQESENEAVFGDIDFQPFLMRVRRDSADFKGSHKEALRIYAQKALGSTFSESDVNGLPTVSMSFERSADKSMIWIWLQLRENSLITVVIEAQPGLPENLKAQIDRIIASVSVPIPV